MNSLKNPINLLAQWQEEELSISNKPLACLSTVGLDGFPNARLVVIRDILDNEIVITGPLNSRKGEEIKNNNKVALTFCWKHANRQVRIQGAAKPISNELADHYFQEISASAKAVSIVCEQGRQIECEREIKKKIAKELAKKITQSANLTRPDSWGGYAIDIARIEFMEYNETKFHKRELYESTENGWNTKQLQP